MYHNVEKRLLKTSGGLDAKYRGWDASGRFHYIGKGGVRGSLWWACERDQVSDTIFGKTLREISEKLTAKIQQP